MSAAGADPAFETTSVYVTVLPAAVTVGAADARRATSACGGGKLK
jgi:hypothetical protein